MSDRYDQSETVDKLLELYVLDLLDQDEASRVDEWLSQDEASRERVRELRSITAMIGLQVEPMEPSARVKAQILETARAESSDSEPIDLHGGRWSRSWLPWAAAAVLAVALIASVAWNLRLQNQVDEQVAVDRYPVALVENNNAAGELLVLPDENAAVLSLSNIGQPEPGRVYQVWLITDNQPQPVTTFLPNQEGAASVAISGDLRSYQMIAITVEPEGGSPQPTTDPVIVGELSLHHRPSMAVLWAR